jgi:hypothetical protein
MPFKKLEVLEHDHLDDRALADAGISLEQIKRRGHVVILLHRYMKAHGMTVADFNQHVLRSPRSSTGVYAWLRLNMGPSLASAKVMAEIMDVPAGFFLPRDLDDDRPIAIPAIAPPPASWATRRGAPPAALVAARGARAATALLPRGVAPSPAVAPPGGALEAPPPYGLRYVSHADGTVTVAVSVRLPARHARPLFRMLMDAGLDGDGDQLETSNGGSTTRQMDERPPR